MALPALHHARQRALDGVHIADVVDVDLLVEDGQILVQEPACRCMRLFLLVTKLQRELRQAPGLRNGIMILR